MAIDPLPDPPSRSEPAEFSDKADDFLSALPLFGEQCNDVAEAMNLNDTSSTSSTSVVIGTGSKSLTVDVSKSYLPGMYVQIARTSDSDNWMNGVVTSYNSGTGALVVNVGHYTGGCNYTNWTITFSAAVLDDVAYTSTMSGGENLTYTSGMERKYIYDPNGADRVLTPSGNFPEGYEAVIKNDGDAYNLTFEGFIIKPGITAEFLFNGSVWSTITYPLDFNISEVGSTGTLANLAGARDVYISGNYAYVASNTADSLTVIDISDPTTPTEVGTVTSANLDGARSVYVSGNYAYVASRDADSLTVIDISDPTTPTEVGTTGTLSNLDGVVGIYVSGNYAYVTSFNAGSLTVIDVSDPTTPVEVVSTGTIANLDGAWNVYVSGNYAYVAAFDADSLTVIDIGGIVTGQAEIGAIKSNNIEVKETLQAGDIHARNGIKAGAQGVSSEGPVSGLSISSPLLSGDSDTGLLSVSTEVYNNDLTGTTRRLALIKDDGELGYDSAGSIDTAELVDLAVTTGKIEDLAVTTAKIADNAVTQDKIGGGVASTFSDPTEFTETSGSTPGPIKVVYKFYYDGKGNIMVAKSDMKHSIGGTELAVADINFDSDTTVGTNVMDSNSTSWTERGETIDLSGLSTGWHDMVIRMRSLSSGIAYLRRFSYYIS